MWEKVREDGTKKLKYNAVPTIFGNLVYQNINMNKGFLFCYYNFLKTFLCRKNLCIYKYQYLIFTILIVFFSEKSTPMENFLVETNNNTKQVKLLIPNLSEPATLTISPKTKSNLSDQPVTLRSSPKTLHAPNVCEPALINQEGNLISGNKSCLKNMMILNLTICC